MLSLPKKTTLRLGEKVLEPFEIQQEVLLAFPRKKKRGKNVFEEREVQSLHLGRQQLPLLNSIRLIWGEATRQAGNLKGLWNKKERESGRDLGLDNDRSCVS
ncbi:hypothetical protein NPIL_6691 [Nephila pilipes]|uniref:Uncharacterized protein n=1 Tax=Nephila pilipes TaxID=299642 RepID=A0A8X6Q6U9_NEPPI|nr:hypothetical protein NPIL_6691 [Nephila pilipes]